MVEARKSTGRTEEREILTLLENSIESFAKTELGRSRLREIRDSGENFDRQVWTKICTLGWLDILTSCEHEIDFTARAIKLVAHYMGVQSAPEPFLECGVGPLSLLHQLEDEKELVQAISNGNILAGHHIVTDDELTLNTEKSKIEGEFIGLQIPFQAQRNNPPRCRVALSPT